MRREDWFERLSDVIARHHDVPFAYGKADCLTFPLECATAMTGRTFDLPAYKTETGAAKALFKAGFMSVGDALASEFEEIPPALAGRGDLVEAINGNQVAGGVCVGMEVVCKSEAGNVLLPRSAIRRAFRV